MNLLKYSLENLYLLNDERIKNSSHSGRTNIRKEDDKSKYSQMLSCGKFFKLMVSSWIYKNSPKVYHDNNFFESHNMFLSDWFFFEK